MLPDLGVQWLCASSYNRAGMQHNDGGNPERRISIFTVDGDGNGRKENTSVIHKGSFQHWKLSPLCSRLEEIMCQIEGKKRMIRLFTMVKCFMKN